MLTAAGAFTHERFPPTGTEVVYKVRDFRFLSTYF